MTNVNQPSASASSVASSSPAASASAPAPSTAATAGASTASKLRVMIVEDETLVGMGLRRDLEQLGHTVVAHASNETEARDEYRANQPDLVFMDIRLNGGDGIELAAELLKERRCPMIILSAYSEQQLVERAGAAGVFGYLIKPATVEGLAAQIEVAFQRFQEQERIRREKDELATALETRKLVERAKGIFMKRFSLEEPEAHKRLQHESQKRRITIGELSKKIIESEELLGG